LAHITKRGKSWQAVWRDPNRRERTKTFARKIDAERHLLAIEHSKLTGTYVDPSAGKVTFRTYAERWRSVQVHRASTATNVDSHLRHLLPRIGERPMGSIRPSEIQALVRSMQTGDDAQRPLAPTTIKVAYSWLTTIFAAAVADRVIPESLCRKIALPPVEQSKVVPLPVETVEALIEAFPDRLQAMIVLGAGTGVGLGEDLGLTADRIDWMRRTVTIDRRLATTLDGAPYGDR
jgi:integrase